MPQDNSSDHFQPPGQAVLADAGPSSTTLFNMATAASSTTNTLSGTPMRSKATSKVRSRSPSRELSRQVTDSRTADFSRRNTLTVSPASSSSSTTLSRTSTRLRSPYPQNQRSPSPTPATKAPYIRRRIAPKNGIYVLYTLAFLSASLDAASFTAWTAFLNMQTGNTIFLALGASGQPLSNPYAWMTALGSIASFIVASHFFAWLSRCLGPRTRLSLTVSFFLQTLCTLIAAVLIQVEYIPVPHGLVSPAEEFPGQPEPRELAAIVPLAFAAAGQVLVTRELAFPLVPTLVLTTLYADAFRDTKLWKFGKQKGENPVRSKMLITILVFVLGAIVGGWVSRSSVGMGAVVWAGVAWRITCTILWAFWPWEEKVEDGERPEELVGVDDDSSDDEEDTARGRKRQRSKAAETQKRTIVWAGNTGRESPLQEKRSKDQDKEADQVDIEAQNKGKARN